MYHSFVMGVDSSIKSLAGEGFDIKADGENYTVSFPKEKRALWEEFISRHLDVGYWNEYLAENEVVFLFRLEDGIKRYEVYDFQNDEVLTLCEKLCECKIESLKSMLFENHFYKQILESHE